MVEATQIDTNHGKHMVGNSTGADNTPPEWVDLVTALDIGKTGVWTTPTMYHQAQL